MGETQSVASGIVEALRRAGADTAFGVSGGASLHLIRAYAETPGCSFFAVNHEQTAAMAADAFTRVHGRPGVAIGTSGPGATNLITGLAGCYFDSIPTIFLTGQVSTTRMVGETGVRQIGFQETPIAEMVQTISKFAVTITDPNAARRIVEEAIWQSRNGRPGPVVIDIPDDVQREHIAWNDLAGFEQPPDLSTTSLDLSALSDGLSRAKRPILILGAGVSGEGSRKQATALVNHLGIPAVLTWAASDVLPANHRLRLGFLGTHGDRHANIAVANSDYLLAVGSRLDTKATGSPVHAFAPDATRAMVDVDAAEIEKFAHFGLTIHHQIAAPADQFIDESLDQLPSLRPTEWLATCRQWEKKLRKFDDELRVGIGLNPYQFLARMTETAPEEADFLLDTGCALPWFMSAYKPRHGLRAFHDFNNTAMGWSIPALLAASVDRATRTAVAVVGDGSLIMGLHDLATVSRANQAAKIVVIDNSGYSMIRQTQDQWFGSDYFASSPEGGLAFPNLEGVLQASGFSVRVLTEEIGVTSALMDFWKSRRPVALLVQIDPSWRVIPQVRFGKPNEDMDPPLPREVLAEMMVRPTK